MTEQREKQQRIEVIISGEKKFPAADGPHCKLIQFNEESVQEDFPQLLQKEELVALLSPDTEEDSLVKEWFQGHKNNKEKYLTSYDADVFVSGSNQPLVPKLLLVLRDCLLSQQWNKALHVLTTVSKVPTGTSHPIWKCGLELMQCDSEENNDSLIRNLYNQMKVLVDINCHEVMLDYLMYLFKKGDLEMAQETIQETIIRIGRKKEVTDRDFYMSLLFKAYSGLVWYVEWKKCKSIVDHVRNTAQDDTGSFMMSSQSSTVFTEMQMNNYAQKAITCFQALQGQPGVWDIFIKKYVELLVYNDQLDEALKILTDHRDTNPENPNSLKYLYSFYEEHYPDSEQTLTLLKEIAERLPADSLVLEYCDRIRKGENSRESVQIFSNGRYMVFTGNEECELPYLFKLLDYPCWQMEARPWMMLADCLEKLLLRRSEEDHSLRAVKTSWDIRKSWWPRYHFTKHQIGKQSTKFGLNFYKAAVAGLLCGFDNEFTCEVRENLQTEELEKLKNILKDHSAGVT